MIFGATGKDSEGALGDARRDGPIDKVVVPLETDDTGATGPRS